MKSVCFGLLIFFLLFQPPASAFTKAEFKAIIRMADDPASTKRVSALAKENPRVLEEVILDDDPKNYHGRAVGLVELLRLLGDSIVDAEKYFDVSVSLLSKIKRLALPKLRAKEHSFVVKQITLLGKRPAGNPAWYSGFGTSLELFIVCIKTLHKHGLVYSEEFSRALIAKVDEAKAFSVTAENLPPIMMRLDGIQDEIEKAKMSVSPAGKEVLLGFLFNLVTQLKERLSLK